ncbi:MAG: hypothetical protein ACHQTE_01710 [Candidatus Saccharimonadales bacterium]
MQVLKTNSPTASLQRHSTGAFTSIRKRRLFIGVSIALVVCLAMIVVQSVYGAQRRV